MSRKKLKTVGQSVPMRGAVELVTGEAKFVDDLAAAELYIKILGSPHAHAMIKEIDTSEAEKLEGVEAVITYKDSPRRIMTRVSARALYILDPHLRHVGDQVAAVAAKSKAVAEKALELIKVQYDILPAVFDPVEAMQPNAPQLYPEGNVYGPQYSPGPEVGINEPTLVSWGDVKEGFAEAEVIVEDEFVVKPQVHAALEPCVTIASWKRDELTLWTCTQVPYEVRNALAHVLEMPESKVRVISQFVGGGFGGKYLDRYQVMTALLSRKAGGKRTKCLLTREEHLVHAKRFLGKEYVKIGAKKDGTLTAIEFKGYGDLGGYGSIFGMSAFWGGSPCCAYNCDHVRFEGWDVHTNYFTSQPYRTVQVPGTTFATEQVMDEMAEKLGMDPTAFRLKNMPENGEMNPPKPWVDNTPLHPRGILENYPSKTIMQQVMDKIEWSRWKGWGKPISVDGAKRRGLGIVYSCYEGGYCFDGFHSMSAVMNKDGSVNILSGCQDMGQSPHTTLCQIVAESLDIPLNDVNIITGDTQIGQFDLFGARGSRELTTGGHLLLVAVEEIKQKVRELASDKLEVRPEEIEVGEKKAYVKEYPQRSVPLSEVITTSTTGSASGPPGSVFPDVVPGVKILNAMVQAAEVEVDIETGEVKILKVVTGNCPGRSINPMIVKGQYNGGCVQALGMALMEEFNYDERNKRYPHASFMEYRVPRAMDTPPIENVIVEEPVERLPHEGTPYGAQGVGELGHWGGPAVIASAIYNAIGERVKTSPMIAERVLDTIKKGVKK